MFIKRNCLCVFFAASLIILIKPAWAENSASHDKPWKKGNIDVGYIISYVDTALNLEADGIGVKIDVEDFLGMDTTNSVTKIKGFWRFTENRRHRLDFKWSSYRRDGYKRILEDFTFEDKDGNTITIPSGTEVFSKFNLDMYKASYSYSFFQDDRIDLAGAVGLYLMPIDIRVNSTGLINVSERENFDAPLPTFGLRADFAITSKWFLRSSLDVFYLELDQFRGSIYESIVAVEYLPWEHLGFGLAFDTFNLHLEADGEDYPGIDFHGKINLNVTGLLLYMKTFF